MSADPNARIDLDAIFKKKSPRLYRFLPGFVLGWMKRIVHQADMNQILDDSEGISDAAFAKFVIENGIKIKLSSKGRENIPETGGCIIAANHPLGGIDGMALVVEVEKVRSDQRFIVNDILMNLPKFNTVFVGVNKVGTAGRQQLVDVENLYRKREYAVLVFPAGLCSRMINGKVQDLPWSKAFVARSQKYQLPIVPVHVKARNSARFYSINLWRRRLGIKANLEMMFLPDEMFRQRGKKIEITFGKPIPPETFTKDIEPVDWAERLRAYVYRLEKTPELTFAEYLASNQ